MASTKKYNTIKSCKPNRTSRFCKKCGSTDLAIQYYSAGKSIKFSADYDTSAEVEKSELITKESFYTKNTYKTNSEVLACHCRICQYNWVERPIDFVDVEMFKNMLDL